MDNRDTKTPNYNGLVETLCWFFVLLPVPALLAVLWVFLVEAWDLSSFRSYYGSMIIITVISTVLTVAWKHNGAQSYVNSLLKQIYKSEPDMGNYDLPYKTLTDTERISQKITHDNSYEGLKKIQDWCEEQKKICDSNIEICRTKKKLLEDRQEKLNKSWKRFLRVLIVAFIVVLLIVLITNYGKDINNIGLYNTVGSAILCVFPSVFSVFSKAPDTYGKQIGNLVNEEIALAKQLHEYDKEIINAQRFKIALATVEHAFIEMNREKTKKLKISK